MIFKRPTLRGASLLALLSLAGISPAFAHAFLIKASPPAGSTQTTAPSRLLLTYSEGLEIPFCSVTVTDPSGKPVPTAKPQPVPGHANEMTLPLHLTAPGKYTVTWRALSLDTHRTKGRFSFTVTTP
jgi:methionine-rich copper-binding protein CopC